MIVSYNELSQFLLSEELLESFLKISILPNLPPNSHCLLNLALVNDYATVMFCGLRQNNGINKVLTWITAYKLTDHDIAITFARKVSNFGETGRA